jgi:hypothetical protein
MKGDEFICVIGNPPEEDMENRGAWMIDSQHIMALNFESNLYQNLDG